MYAGTIAFLFGVIVLQHQPELPNPYWSLLPVLLLPLAWRYPILRLPAWAVCGFLWAALYGGYALSGGLTPALEGKDVVVEGRVASIPQAVGEGLRFELDVARLLDDGVEVAPPSRIRLTWYREAPALRAGERWRLKVRLKQPRGFMNPGGFDYEGWLLQRGIRATGYVRAAADNRRLAAAHPLDLQAMRHRLRDAIWEATGGGPNTGILVALAIGESRGIEERQWDLLTGTGTNHLVAISGLHITLVAGMAFFAVRRAWAWAGRAALRWPAPKAAALAAILAAAMYAALAGFAIPTQRALIMVITAMSGLLLGRNSTPGRTLALALLLVLVFDPTAVLAVGFWLSFGAVAVILLSVVGRIAPGGIWWKWGRLQWLVTVGLAPILLLFFRYVPLVSPLANLVAIPWVSFVVTPLTLLGTAMVVLVPPIGQWLLQVADMTAAPLWPFFEWLLALPHAQWTQHTPAAWTLAAAGIGILLLLAPRGFPGRWLAVVYVLPVVLVSPARPAEGTVWFTLLDVGQGLAAVVRTQNHVLVYDAGPRFNALDTGAAVVVPYLRHVGVRRIDTLVLSHSDNDHSGGAAAVLAQIPTERVLAGEPEHAARLFPGAAACHDGQSWRWDGVEFRVLHPAAHGASVGNDRTCVLRISAGNFSLLLTGDIERGAEARLVSEHGDELAAEAVIIPHHGSKTSSTPAFVAAARPRYALAATGYRNPFHFPHPEVTARYEAAGAAILNTARDGAILFRLDPVAGIQSLERYRQTARRYWHTP